MKRTATKRMPTHLFLASLGKTRLRPGGKEATNRMIQQCQITSDTKVLEVAPNMGTTAMYLAQTFGCHVTGIDLHAPSLEKAKQNIKEANLEDKITLLQGNALKLPFENDTFDVVINEAMLSMLPNEQKKRALSEYYRVLKPGGRLATHDMLFKYKPTEEQRKELQHTINVNAQPLELEEWLQIFHSIPFTDLHYDKGNMTLLSLKGLIIDEGWETMLKIINNALKDEDSKKYLFDIIKRFDDNQDLYGHITFCAQK